MEIQEIKNRLTLAMLLQHYGLKADKQNRLKCPFHNDKTPSLQLYYKTQTAFCFSTNCQTHGKAIDVIDFILHYEKCTKHAAIQKAQEILSVPRAERFGKAIKKAESIINPGAATTQTTAPKQTNEKGMFLERMFTYFKNAVHNSKPAREYIDSRNLDYRQLEIGYNAGQFHHGTRKDESLINDCLKYGVLLDLGLKSRTGETAYKPFGKWCIVFALRNPDHEITGLYFRSTLGDKNQRHFYLRDRSGLYPGYPEPETQQLILTESIIDAASLLQQSLSRQSGKEIKSKYEILSLYGTNGFTEEHQAAIRKLEHLNEIIFFLNGDEAGNKAVAKYAPMLKSEYPNLKATSVAVPENEDVNSLLQGHSPEILTHLVETRKEVDFILYSQDDSFSNGVRESAEPISSDGEPPQADIFLSNEKPVEKEKSEQAKALVTGLDTTNPYNLKYMGNACLPDGTKAGYQIKGFRTDQPDSLKTTIQTIAEASSITLKLDLYEYKQVESPV